MPEPDWKQDLADWVATYVDGSDRVRAYALRSLLPHVEAAYQRGLQAGRSQGRQTNGRSKWRKEEQCTPTAAPSAGTPSPASSTEDG